jgi:predicted amidophosphoribosyltransferase
VERVTFCPACGSQTPQANPRCEMCNAPLRRATNKPLDWALDWRRWIRWLPTPSPLVLLVTLAVIALGVAVVTAIVFW